MGRSIATVFAVVALILGIGLIDRDGERSTGLIDGAEATTPAPAPAGGDAPSPFEDVSGLSSCLDPARAAPASSSPELSSRGVAEISRRIEKLRELRFDGPVDASFLSPEEITRRIDGLLQRDYPASLARRQGAVLELLGAIPPGSDLLALTRKTLSSQVVGLFVPETKELLVVKSGAAGAIEEITLSHELEHALAFDSLGFPLPERTRAGSSDRDLAAQALIEGDATLTMEQYALRYIGLGDQLDLLGDPELATSERGLNQLPDFLRRQLLFPYEAGLQFVCDRYRRGGWAAVDRAYEHPPLSTAELLGLAPDSGDPIDPPRPKPLPTSWRRTLSGQLGAAELTWLFAAPGGEVDRALPDPRDAIAGWKGGEFELWLHGGESALAVSLVDRGSGSLCGATIAWYAAAFPGATLGKSGTMTTFASPGQDAAIACPGSSVRLGIAPAPELAARLAS